MAENILKQLQNLNFIFENSLITVIANRNLKKVELAGLNVGPFEEGNTYDVQFWIAQILEKAGIVRFNEGELLETPNLYKIQWTERIQTVGQLSQLPANFYPKLRRFLLKLQEEAGEIPEKLQDYQKIKHLARDTVNLRLKKIVSLATIPTKTGQILKSLTAEEKMLYDRLYVLVNEWRIKILESKGVEE